MKKFNKNTALVLLESQEDFPIDFDDAWRWLGFSTKQKALEKLKAHHIEGLEFLTVGLKTSSKKGGRPSEHILLTTDCLKTMGMMAGTEKGREIRRYFLECEHQLKQIAQKAQPIVTNADIATALEELEKMIVSIRSHPRAVHTCTHQPMDELLAKSLHSLSHNQLSAIASVIHQMQTLKQFAETEWTESVTEETTPPEEVPLASVFPPTIPESNTQVLSKSEPKTDNTAANDTYTRSITIQCNSALYASLQNQLKALHGKNDYSFTSVTDMESWIGLQYNILDDLESKGLIRQPQKGSSRRGRTYALLNKKGMAAARSILEKIDIKGAKEALEETRHHEEYIRHKNKIERDAEKAESEEDFD